MIKNWNRFNENNEEDSPRRWQEDWQAWYNWDNLDEIYIVYNCVNDEVERVDATYFRDNFFLEDDWDKVGNLEVAETCKIHDYIITRVK